MKNIIFGLALLTILGAFTACENPSNSSVSGDPPFHPPSSGINRVSFNHQYIHTQYVRDTYIGNITLPLLTVVSSTSELESYYDNYKALFNFELPPDQLYTPIGFLDAIKDYSDDFFENSFLVIILLHENSGSNRHEVEGVYDNGDIVINRLIPELGSADMAQWSIIIELDNNNKPEEFKTVLIEKQV